MNRPLIFALALLASASTAQAQDQNAGRGAALGKLHILTGLHFGGGGEGVVDPENGGATTRSDMRPVVGFQAGMDYWLVRYFSLGGELRASFWNTELFDDLDVGRSTFLDINLKPKGGYRFDGLPLEVYGTLPMGLSLTFLNDDLDDLYGNVNDIAGSPGFNLGFGVGAAYFFTEHVGLNAEMLGVFHWFKSTTEFTSGNQAKADNGVAQFYFFVNAAFAF